MTCPLPNTVFLYSFFAAAQNWFMFIVYDHVFWLLGTFYLLLCIFVSSLSSKFLTLHILPLLPISIWFIYNNFLLLFFFSADWRSRGGVKGFRSWGGIPRDMQHIKISMSCGIECPPMNIPPCTILTNEGYIEPLSNDGNIFIRII